MADRAYLYSINEVPGLKEKQILTLRGVSEFSYGVPLSFLALISGNPLPSFSVIWNDGEKSAIIADYDQGVENFQMLVNLLMEQNLVSKELFKKHTEKSLSYLRNPKHRQQYFILELGELNYPEQDPEQEALKIIDNSRLLMMDVFQKNFKSIELLNQGIKENWEEIVNVFLDWESLYYSFDESIDFQASPPKPKVKVIDTTPTKKTYIVNGRELASVDFQLSDITNNNLSEWEQKIVEYYNQGLFSEAFIISWHILTTINLNNSVAKKYFIAANKNKGQKILDDPMLFLKTYTNSLTKLDIHKLDAKRFFKLGGEYYLQSKKEFTTCMTLDPKDPEYPRMIGEIYLINHEPDKAAEYLKKAWDLAPENYEYMTRYAIALVRMQKIEETRKIISLAKQNTTNSKDVFDNLGMIFLLLGELEESKQYFQKAIEILPTYSYFQNHMTLVQRELADKEQRRITNKQYTPLYLRQKGQKKWFNGDKLILNHEARTIKIDSNLTPDNCETKGYEWQEDTIFDPRNSEENNLKSEEIAKIGWKLGQPTSENLARNNGFGIYRLKNRD